MDGRNQDGLFYGFELDRPSEPRPSTASVPRPESKDTNGRGDIIGDDMTTTRDTRPLSEAERQAIAHRYGATRDVQAVTICKPCAVTPWDNIQDRWKRQSRRGRVRGLDRMNAR